jgi:hypothetical protein
LGIVWPLRDLLDAASRTLACVIPASLGVWFAVLPYELRIPRALESLLNHPLQHGVQRTEKLLQIRAIVLHGDLLINRHSIALHRSLLVVMVNTRTRALPNGPKRDVRACADPSPRGCHLHGGHNHDAGTPVSQARHGRLVDRVLAARPFSRHAPNSGMSAARPQQPLQRDQGRKGSREMPEDEADEDVVEGLGVERQLEDAPCRNSTSRSTRVLIGTGRGSGARFVRALRQIPALWLYTATTRRLP